MLPQPFRNSGALGNIRDRGLELRITCRPKHIGNGLLVLKKVHGGLLVFLAVEEISNLSCYAFDNILSEFRPFLHAPDTVRI